MSGIKRYEIGYLPFEEEPSMAYSKTGDYVAYSDHEAEVARLRAEVEDNEKAINVWRGRTQRAEAEVEALRKTLGEVTQCLSDTVDEVGGWAVEEVIEAGMEAAMGASA